MNGPSRARVLAAALASGIALATFHPGVEGDLLRAWTMAGGALLLGLLVWRRHRDPEDPRRGALLPLLALGVIIAAAAAQLVPLPRGLIRWLAPATASIYDLEQAARGASDAAFRPLSIEPGATGRAALLALAYLSVFVVARAIARDRRAATGLLLSIALIGAGCAVFALAHQAGSPPGPWRGRACAPFVNPDHLATFLALCLGPALALLLVPDRARSEGRAGSTARPAGRRRDPGAPDHTITRRALLAVAVVLMVIGLIATRSRGGVLAAAATALLALPAAGGGTVRRTVGAAAGAIVILGLGLALSDPEPLERRLDRGGVSLSGRLDNWSTAVDVIRARPWIGSGLGTFDDASRAVLDPDTQRLTRPGSAHNDYLELAATCGIPAALLALLLLAAGLAPAARDALHTVGSQRAVAIGSLAGAGGAALHAGFDFALSIPGPALLFATCLGLGCGAGCDRRPIASGWPRPRIRQGLRIGGALSLAIAAGLILLQAGREARARAAHDRARAPEITTTLRPTFAKQSLTPLRVAAQSPIARADIPFRRAEAVIASQSEWSGEARAAAAAAARGAPGRAEHQAQLAVILLNLACTGSTIDEDLLREGDGRLRLAVSLSPAQPQILRTALDAELGLLARTGARDRLPRAQELIRRVLIHDPQGSRWVRQLLKRHEAALGALSTPLLESAHRSP